MGYKVNRNNCTLKGAGMDSISRCWNIFERIIFGYPKVIDLFTLKARHPHEQDTNVVVLDLLTDGFTVRQALRTLKRFGLRQPSYEEAWRVVEENGKRIGSEIMSNNFALFIHEPELGPIYKGDGGSPYISYFKLGCPGSNFLGRQWYGGMSQRFQGFCRVVGIKTPRSRI